jgi:cytochrome c-type biogenesis protein CcmE
MKKIHIIGIVIIALSVGVIISTISDSSTYTGFEEASVNPGMEFQVVGSLNLDQEMTYDPQTSPFFTFALVDKQGKEELVKFKGSKPQDFERSDQVVITGQYIDGEFIASKILMKCPSKYNDGKDMEVKATSES